MKPEGRKFEIMVVDDPWVEALENVEHVQKVQREFNRMNEIIYCGENFFKKQFENNPEEGTMFLYEVFVVYAVEGAKPIIKLPPKPYYCARNEEEAKISSRAVELVDPSWDPEGVTIICNELGQIKVKK